MTYYGVKCSHCKFKVYDTDLDKAKTQVKAHSREIHKMEANKLKITRYTGDLKEAFG